MSRRVGIKAAAEATGLSQWELRQGARSGRYPHIRVGDSEHGRIIFDLDLLEEHIKLQMMQNVKIHGQDRNKFVEFGKLRKVAE